MSYSDRLDDRFRLTMQTCREEDHIKANYLVHLRPRGASDRAKTINLTIKQIQLQTQ